MKIALLTLVICALMFSELIAQLGSTKTEIAQNHGWNFESGVTTDEFKVNYIYYDKQMQSNSGGNYQSRYVFYFNEKGYCNQQKIMEPISEINAWIKYFNSDMVRIDKMKWKDYSTGIVYHVESKEEIVIVTSFYEGED
jgi:hypothetical protein